MLDTAASLCNWSLKHAVAASLLSDQGIKEKRKRDGGRRRVCVLVRAGSKVGDREEGRERGRVRVRVRVRE